MIRVFLRGPNSIIVCEISELTENFLRKLCDQTKNSRTNVLKEIARRNKYVLDEQKILRYILEKANFCCEKKKGPKEC